ncbi:TetR/AcrR family transcriptional regulator [Komagataeibacter sp. FXV3]|uniref:TetR/AcrR family transcriptional regulator n=1 Tax=Komagataeibacter sp. FXV3 TaxID=2608998 RepID=UPI00187B65AF|nr:TetR/AcrR family transcriptional regulator [Komagataeibacter sp. FXV3]MBE7728650.1 TetR/AcrR family transcriptional regulator [Komagataeibacter sp. FXV3]
MSTMLGKPRRSGRPTPEDSARLDRYLLDVAGRLFIANGYAGTSMGQIARAAGASKQTIYHRYVSKEALFKAVITHLSASLLETDTEASLRDPLQALKEVCRMLLDFIMRDNVIATYRMMIADGYRYPGLIDHAMDEIVAPFHGRITTLLTAAVAAGQIRSGTDNENTSRLLTGIMTGWPIQQRLLGLYPLHDMAARAAFLEAAWSMFLRGVAD